MKWRAIVPVLVLVMALGACGFGEGRAEDGGQAAADSAAADSSRADSLAQAKKADAVPVEVAPAQTGTISSYLLFNSTIETEAAVEIYPRVGGQVERVRAEEGDRVAAGDTLLSIDDEQLHIAAREAAVNLDHLEKGFERTEEMFRRKLISDQEYENKRYELEQARLRAERARLELEHTAIRAPFSGVVTERQVQVGARVGPSTKLFALIKLEDMIARVYVPGQYLTAIRTDQEAVVTSEFLQGRRFDGWVKRISPVVDPKSGTFKVTVGLSDRWEYLRPGIFVEVRIVTDTHERAVLVPKEAVVYDGGDKYVYAVQDSVAARIRLVAGFEDSRHVEALEGIEPETPIIVVGQNGLKDRARVRVVNAPATPEAGRSPAADGRG